MTHIFAERSFPPCFSHFKPFNHFCFYGSLIMQFHFSTCLRKTVYKCSTSCLINTGRKNSHQIVPPSSIPVTTKSIFLTFWGATGDPNLNRLMACENNQVLTPNFGDNRSISMRFFTALFRAIWPATIPKKRTTRRLKFQVEIDDSEGFLRICYV